MVLKRRIIATLKVHGLSAKAANLCRADGISEATHCSWKSEYGRVDISAAKRPKALETENTRLKKLLADVVLDKVAPKDLLSEKW